MGYVVVEVIWLRMMMVLVAVMMMMTMITVVRFMRHWLDI